MTDDPTPDRILQLATGIWATAIVGSARRSLRVRHLEDG